MCQVTRCHVPAIAKVLPPASGQNYTQGENCLCLTHHRDWTLSSEFRSNGPYSEQLARFIQRTNAESAFNTQADAKGRR